MKTSIQGILSLVAIALFAIPYFATAQNIKITFCAAATEVDPPTDSAGNDIRHISWSKLRYIQVSTFGANPKIIYDLFSPTSSIHFDEAVFIDGCYKNNNPGNCKACTVCVPPTVNGGTPYGTVWSLNEDYTGTMRVRGHEGQLLIEATNYKKQMCYTTPPLDVSDYAGKVLGLKVGFEGMETTYKGKKYRSSGVYIYYQFNDGTKYWHYRRNRFVGPQEKSLSRTEIVPKSSSSTDIDKVPYHLQLHATAVQHTLQIKMLSPTPQRFELSLLDVQGIVHKVRHATVLHANREESIDWEVHDLPPGKYYLLTRDQEGRFSFYPFIKL